MTERLVSLDIARGLAVIMMIAAHASDAFLSEQWKSGVVWNICSISFGFVAPAFLFLTGVVLVLAYAQRRRVEKKYWERSLEWRMTRLALLGFWLQIPVMSLQRLVTEGRPDDLGRLFDVNILQVIGLTGLAILVLTRLSGGIRNATPALWVLAAMIAAATPYLWSLSLDIGLPLAPWVAPSSTFPLFPYGFYPLAGFVLARSVLRQSEPPLRGIILALIGIVAIVGVRLADRLAQLPEPWNDLWGSSPLHLLFRLGGVLILIGGAFGFARRQGRFNSAIAYIGRKSLAIYVVHLIVIYGSPATMGGRYWFNGALNGKLTPPGLLLVTVVVLGISLLAIALWDAFRTRFPEPARWTKRLAWTAFWGAFVFG